MKWKESPFRAVGQRSLDSSFLSSSSNPFRVAKEESRGKASKKISPLSLSDFLHKKLNETSQLPNTVKGKSKPFSSLLGLRGSSRVGCNDEQAEAKKGGESCSNPVVEKVVLEQLKPSGIAKLDYAGSSNVNEAQGSDITDAQGSRKRRFEGVNERPFTRKHFAVLGGESKRKQQRRDEIIIKENQIPAYNHCRNLRIRKKINARCEDANGGGWWDSEMEGVDNEEVGFSEVWEGVGSTTFGGIVDWH